VEPHGVSERTGVVGLELDEPLGELDLGPGRVCRVLLTFRGVPVAYHELAPPGPGAGRELAELLFGRHASYLRRREEAIERLAKRMGLPEPAPVDPVRVTVVVCTHRRAGHLGTLLRALGELDPAPHEVVIVDNDPGDGDCRDAVAAAGFVYVREDARGLDRARTAGIRAATGDVVAFTDDDCIPPPGWLARMPEHFADGSVGAVTGPGFAWTLATPSQIRFEREDGFRRGLQLRRHDWTTLPPARASAAGAGANMAFRRDLLLELGEPFPAELDAGTPTQSGGDMWAFAAVLRSGHRIVYDPATWLFHNHRPDPRSLHHALWGYGVGLTAAVVKLAAAGERGGWSAWWWLARHYRAGALARATGMSGPVRQRLGWDYLRGGLQGPLLYRRARRGLTEPVPRLLPRAAVASAAAPSALAAPVGAPEVSVIVPTFDRPAALGRLLDSLAVQAAAPSFEVIVVDDARPADAALQERRAGLLAVRVLGGGRSGPARARNRGAEAAAAPLLLFLDDDMVVDRGFVAAHAGAHDGSARIVVGWCPPAPSRRSWAAEKTSWWWWDYFRAREDTGAPDFKDVLSGNTSMSRSLFHRLGGFDERYAGHRREDWDLGIRAREAGVETAFADHAVAVHEFSLDTRRLLAAAYAEGRGDAMLMAAHADVAAALPAGGGYGRPSWRRSPKRRLAVRLLGGPVARRAAVRGLDALERRGRRGTWNRWADLVREAAYAQGLRDGGARPPRSAAAAPVEIDLAGSEPIAPPRVAVPEFALTGALTGRRRVRHPAARWNRELATRLVDGLDVADLLEGAPELDPGGPAPPVISLSGSFATVDRAIRDASTPCVVMTLPRVAVSAGWGRTAALALRGAQVAAVHGAGGDGGKAFWGLTLYSSALLPERLLAWDVAPGAVAISVARYREAGGLDASLWEAGPMTVLLDLLERMLERGLVIGVLDVPGLTPPGRAGWTRRRNEWRRDRALAILAYRHGRRLGGGAGASWLLRRGIVHLAGDVLLLVFERGKRRARIRRITGSSAGWLAAIRRRDGG
jgi:GT2 family glycosyltransferase